MPGTTPETPPRPLLVGAAIVLAQGALLVAGAIYLAIAAAVGHAEDVEAALTLAVLAAVFGVGMGLLARGLFRARLWARTPVVFLDVLFLPVAYTLIRSGWAAFGAAYGVLSLAVLVLVFTPAARTALEQ